MQLISIGDDIIKKQQILLIDITSDDLMKVAHARECASRNPMMSVCDRSLEER